MFVHSSPVVLLKKRWKLLFISGLILAISAGFFSLLLPLEYRADAQVYIISKSRYGVDPYTVVKSAERVGENLIQLTRTSDFYNKVMEQPGHDLDKSMFENVSERTKRKRWQKTVQTSVVYGTGVLNISAYNEDPDMAKKYAGATADTLAAQGWQYVGGDVTIKVVNEPVVSRFPMRPNVLLNAILGFILGILLSGVLIIKKN
mgnify:CR=1 FL=1